MSRSTFRASRWLGAGLAWLLVAPATVALIPEPAAAQGETVPLPITLPRPVFPGTPRDIPAGTSVERTDGRPRAIPQVPRGTVNLALNRKVTSSRAPFAFSLDLVTDGNKEARETTAVELRPGLQWVQIDLGAVATIHYVCVWHYHLEPVVVRDVIVQLSNDPTFLDGVTTIFNNDQDNSAGLGVGRDREYFETSEGRLIPARGVKARYVRLYSRGSTFKDPLNRYTEVEVFGQQSAP
ncbi:MAG TPA: hypothetical protein VLH79_03695 [Chthonomonadales bacterium]|nr:hypothetical protein [Chthonomonadales bacterium]